MAKTFCQFQQEACRDAYGDIRPDGLRINDADPCLCIADVMKQYKRPVTYKK